MSGVVVFACGPVVEMRAIGDLDTNDVLTVATIATRRAVELAEQCGCDGCRSSLPKLRQASRLLGALGETPAPIVGRA